MSFSGEYLFLTDDILPRACVAALVLILFSLSCAITLVRLRTKTLFYGAPSDPASLLTKLVRAHGNTAEYAAILSVMILVIGSQPRPGWVSVLMALAVVGRLLFVVGMLTTTDLTRFDPVRATGVTATYVSGFGLALALLIL